MTTMNERVTKSQNVVFIVRVALFVKLWMKLRSVCYALEEKDTYQF